MPLDNHDDDQIVMPCKCPMAFEWKLNHGWNAEARLQRRIQMEESVLSNARIDCAQCRPRMVEQAKQEVGVLDRSLCSLPFALMPLES